MGPIMSNSEEITIRLARLIDAINNCNVTDMGDYIEIELWEWDRVESEIKECLKLYSELQRARNIRECPGHDPDNDEPPTY